MPPSPRPIPNPPVARGIVALHAGAVVALALCPAARAFAGDMMGPDFFKLVMALPLMALYAIGEFALFLAPLFLVLAAVVAVLGRFRIEVADHVPSASTLLVLAALAAVPGFIYWNSGAVAPDPAAPPRVSTPREPKMDPLAPPVGKAWPKETGYLNLPQQAQGGLGVIRVRASMNPVYVKLCEAGKQPCPGLRHAYVARSQEIVFRGLPAGEYEVRYLPIERPRVGGRSRPIRVADYVEDDHVVRVDDSPTLDAPRKPVVGIYAKDF